MTTELPIFRMWLENDASCEAKRALEAPQSQHHVGRSQHIFTDHVCLCPLATIHEQRQCTALYWELVINFRTLDSHNVAEDNCRNHRNHHVIDLARPVSYILTVYCVRHSFPAN